MHESFVASWRRWYLSSFQRQVGISQAEQEEGRGIKIVEEEPKWKQKGEQNDFNYY